MTPGSSDGDQDRTIVAAPRNATLGPGSKILNDTYVIERCLGKGGMGEVYEASHIELGSKRAIKIILPEYARNTQYVALFIEEARKLSRVTNDAVVRYFEFSRDETGARYLVMEFVDGESLSAVLDHRALTVTEVAGLIVRLAQGLAAAYDQGIKAHRDISPANILVPQGRVEQAKVIDFGIAKSADGGMTVIGSDFAGKYSYVSPEQVGLFGGAEEVDERSDIYSLGLLAAAAAMGFGKRLDMGSEPASVTLARQKVPELSKVPAELRPLLTRMLQPHREDRPASMRELIEEARQLITPSVARPAAKKRFPIWRLAAGLAALAAIGGIAIFLLQPKPVPQTPAAPEPPFKPPIASQPPIAPPPEQQALTPSPPPQTTAPPQVTPLSPPQVTAPPPPSAETVFAEFNDTVKTMDCATFRPATLSQGTGRIEGNVTSKDDRAKLLAIVDRIPAADRPEVQIEVIPAPLCQSIQSLAALQTDGGLQTGGVELKMAEPGPLHTGDPIAVVVDSLYAYSLNLRIDYFTLTGDVLHMWPNANYPTAVLAAREIKKFLNSGPGDKVWEVGGAPFGTEYITVIATPKALGGNLTSGPVEPAADYLRKLQDALQHATTPAGQQNFLATVFVHTAEK